MSGIAGDVHDERARGFIRAEAGPQDYCCRGLQCREEHAPVRQRPPLLLEPVLSTPQRRATLVH